LKGHGFSHAVRLLICRPSPAQRAGDLLFLATGNWQLATGYCLGYFRFLLPSNSLAFALPSELQPSL